MEGGTARLAAFALLLAACLDAVGACMPDSGSGLVGIGEETYVCLVINDKHISVLKPKADDYFRWDLQGSFKAATTATDGTTASCDSEFWWGTPANECPWKSSSSRALLGDDAALELDAASAEAMLQRSRMLANGTNSDDALAECEGKASTKQNPGTTFYVESMGVVANYKKTYISHCGGGIVFPIITAVITADQGTVTDVYWDDGCYLCADDGNTAESSMGCMPNAYTLQGKATTVADGLGKDCGLTRDKCLTKSDTFCDLNLYVVWTGTDKNGNYFRSAGKRFSRFREYAMPSLFSAMEDLLDEA